jgi:Trypsin-like peptidase domain
MVSQPTFTYERAPWQVGIRREPESLPVGGGMLCPDGHVVTCAHVVSKDAERPDGPVYVEFQHADQHEPIPAVVVDGGWYPAAGEGGRRGDVAVLRLTVAPPPSAVPAPLRPSPENVDKPHSFHTYGYPVRHP